MVAAVVALAASAPSVRARAADEPPPPAGESPRPSSAAIERRLEIAEFRILGATRLSPAELEAAVAPFLGSDRALDDVEQARAAIEKAYMDRGWQTVLVTIPQQTVRDGVVTLDVMEGRVARLRVKGARWFSPADVRALAPSVAEGESPNFNAIVKDLFVLNQLADRRVTPSLRAGPVPGTVLVDLDVEDRIPVHASVEMNDRYSQGTTPLRLAASVRDENLWQLGHTLSATYQVAPQRADDGQVLTVSYLARFPRLTWLSLSASATWQDSDVAAVGGVTVLGKGRVVGTRATFTLSPPSASWFQTASLGFDYKYYTEGVFLGASGMHTPITYYPFTAQYATSWQADLSRMSIDLSGELNARGFGSATEAFDRKRYQATGSFALLRVEVARSDALASGFEFTERARAQLTDSPLVAPEMFVIGGADSVRGYVEARAAGDAGAAAQLEAWSPSLTRWIKSRVLDDWRFLVFTDLGWTKVHQPLPEQTWHFGLWSAGAGTRFRTLKHFYGSFDVGVPLVAAAGTPAGDVRLHFRVWSEF
jgi:hemolysin activation/secretion protein